MKNYVKIFKKNSKINSKIYNINNTSLILLLCSKLSNLITPFFLILKINANKITYLNFINSLIIILCIWTDKKNFFQIAIILYFFYLIIDFCDGSVARYKINTSFYGRFIDGLSDIFLKTFLILSISFYSFKILNSLSLLIFGCIASIFIAFDTFILDRYSAIVRWFNSNYKENLLPYIKKKFLFKFSLFINDIYFILIGSILLTQNDNFFLFCNLVGLFCINILSALINIFIHLYSAFINLQSKKMKY